VPSRKILGVKSMSTTKSKLLRRSTGEASAYLDAKHGIKRSAATLARDALSGTGPAFVTIGNRVFYSTDSLDAYAKAQLNKKPSPFGRKLNWTKGREPTPVATDKKPEADAGGLS
jgi:hypothetical protein